MVPSVGTAAAAKAAHALECIGMFGDFVGELEPRWDRFEFRDPLAGLAWKGGGDAGAGVSRAADLLDYAAEAADLLFFALVSGASGEPTLALPLLRPGLFVRERKGEAG